MDGVVHEPLQVVWLQRSVSRAALELVPVRIGRLHEGPRARRYRGGLAPSQAFPPGGKSDCQHAAVGDGVPGKHVPELLLALLHRAAVVRRPS